MVISRSIFHLAEAVPKGGKHETLLAQPSALLRGCRFGWLRDAPNGKGTGGGTAHVEFDFARQFDDRFGMMTVLEQRVFHGLRTADEQAAVKAVLFLGDPLAAPVPANKDDRRRTTTRWRFDELHVGIPSEIGSAANMIDRI
jgi:hypothetical protein